MITIQYDSNGHWTNIIGHGCTTRAEMDEYVKALGPTRMRVAEESTQGEETNLPRKETLTQTLDRMYENADEAGKARLQYAVDELKKALRS